MIFLLIFLFFFSFTVVVHGCEAVTRLESRATAQPSQESPFLAAGWYAAWHNLDSPLTAVNWSKYNVVAYAFAVTTSDPSIILLADSDQVLLPNFVQTAHRHHVKATLSFGGWTGSRFFSTNVGSAANRTAFVRSIVDLIKRYNLDGVDLDWEYPGKQGVGCNVVSPNDTANFLFFLQQLRQAVGTEMIISAAVDIKPFPGASGKPSPDIPKFAEVLSYITVMNYDISSTPSGGAGPHTPLDDSCAPSNSQAGSAKVAITAWADAGMPKSKIVLGVAAYGHSFRVRKSAAFASGSSSILTPFPSFEMDDKPKGDRWNGNGGINVCGDYEPPGGTYAFRNLVDDGFLYANGSTKPGIAYRYDECSKTPFLYDPKSQTFIAYDNPDSFVAKGSFIKKMELKGFSMWELAGDPRDILLNAILNGTLNDTALSEESSTQASTSATATTAKAGATSSSSASALHSFSVMGWILTLILYCLYFGLNCNYQ